MNKQVQIAVFGGGCFWCTEAAFNQLKGVMNVTSGYAGGTVYNPTYEQVCSGQTNHAEVIKIEYDPEIISYKDLLSIFFSIHDPTTLNRQGNDIGTQYRSIIFYANEEQKEEARQFIAKLEKDKIFTNQIVTEIKPLRDFYQAEENHAKYYEKNKYKPYCLLNINPKLKKIRTTYKNLLK